MSENKPKTGDSSGGVRVDATVRQLIEMLRDALATIHDTNEWIHENEPNAWAAKVRAITNDAIDAADAFLGEA